MKPVAYMGRFDIDNPREAGVVVTRDKEDLNHQSRGKPDCIDALYTADQLRQAKVSALREAANKLDPTEAVSGSYSAWLRRLADEIEKGEQ